MKLLLVLVIVVTSWAEGTLDAGRLSPQPVYVALLARMSLFTTSFMGIFIEGLPFLLLGALAAGLVKELFTVEDLSQWALKNEWLGALAGGLLGLVIPVGKAGAPPLARQFMRKGMPVPVGMAMLFAMPVLNPVVLAVTYSAFGFGLIFWGRIGLTYLIAVALAVLFAKADRDDNFRPVPDEEKTGPAPVPSAGFTKSTAQRVLAAAVDEFFDLGRFLVLGALLAAFLQSIIPTAGLSALGQEPLLSVVGMMLLAVMLSAGPTEDAWIVLPFVGILPAGSILAFLVVGPLMDIPQVLALRRVLRTRMVVYSALLVVLVTLVAGYAINLGGLQ